MPITLSLTRSCLMCMASCCTLASFVYMLLFWPLYYIHIDSSNDVWFSYQFDTIQRKVETDDATTIQYTDWGESGPFQSDNDDFKGTFTLHMVLTVIAICLTCCTFVMQTITNWPGCMCKIFEGRVNLIKMITSGLTMILVVTSVILFCLNLPGNMADGMSSCPSEDHPCNTLIGSNDSMNMGWGLDYGMYFNIMMAFFMIFIFVVIFMYRDETPQSSNSSANSGYVNFTLGMNLRWSRGKWLWAFGIMIIFFGYFSYVWPWYYVKSVNTSSDTESYVDYKLGGPDVVSIQDPGSRTASVTTSHRSWGDDGYDGEVRDTFLICFIFWIIAALAAIFYCILNTVTQYPRLKCPCFPASMYLLRTIAAAAILAFHSLSFFIFIFTISDSFGEDMSGSCPSSSNRKHPCNSLIGSHDEGSIESSWGFDFGFLSMFFIFVTGIFALVMSLMHRSEPIAGSRV
eukprot:TRINITY_DN25144_c0_g1_i1.p1 TRINITY_DN25144_c0_g1~~TRINITY_DN25144_c0_g1_i1.p1  ORF type:complete len:458 (+),score=73.13 TRINITY_DN25144_c0_g1_i1:38-1411(+)